MNSCDRNMKFVDSNGHTYPEWEEKKLGEIAILRNGYAFDSKSYQETGTYSVTTISNVTGDRYVDSSGSKKVTNIPSDIRNHQVLKRGDILISLTGNVGRVSVVNEANLLLNQRVGLLDINLDIDLNREFLYQILSQEHFLSAMVGSGQGAAQKNIKKEDVENYLFSLPSLAEQQKIAEFFNVLDERIELTAEKIRLLKDQKQGYLQRVFNGDMAFTDDSGNPYPAWEQKKLRDVLNLHSGKDQKGFEDPNGQYPILATGGEIGRTNTPLCEEESVLIGRKGTIDKPKYMDAPFRTVDTLFYTTMKEGISAKFIYVVVQTVKWKKLSEASGVPSLNSSIILNVDCPVPSLPEQVKIAEFFSALDEQIELIENKLTLLKEQKKGYLQGIFG